MQPRELFGVGVRWIGLIAIVLSLPGLLSLNYFAAAQSAAQTAIGLILMTRADQIAEFCYPRRKDPGDAYDESRDR